MFPGSDGGSGSEAEDERRSVGAATGLVREASPAHCLWEPLAQDASRPLRRKVAVVVVKVELPFELSPAPARPKEGDCFGGNVGKNSPQMQDEADPCRHVCVHGAPP